MGLFDKLFGENKKGTDNLEPKVLTEPEILDLLATAISDVGCWRWWITDLPEVAQIEFNETLLYFSVDDKSKPPSSQIAIQFRKPKSISFLTRDESLQTDWFDLLQKDQIEPFRCDFENFTFTDTDRMKNILSEAKAIKTIHGYSPTDNRFYSEPIKLAFWAGNAGFAISAGELRLFGKDGKIELQEIQSINKMWWDYWKEYWKVINTDKAFPKDFACEVTMPI